MTFWKLVNGRDALQVLAGCPVLPSLILVDLAMPVRGGDELVPILDTKYPGMKIIVSSGYPEEDVRKGFPSRSVVGFLQKPYTITVLAGRVGASVSGSTGIKGIIRVTRTSQSVLSHSD